MDYRKQSNGWHTFLDQSLFMPVAVVAFVGWYVFNFFTSLNGAPWIGFFFTSFSLMIGGASLIVYAKYPVYRSGRFFTFGLKSVPGTIGGILSLGLASVSVWDGAVAVFVVVEALGRRRTHPMENELFHICCERDPKPADQRKRLALALKQGADIHATDKNGVTALHHAVRFRSPAAVLTLIKHGAEVNQVCRRTGSTPLHRAVTQTGAPGTAGKSEAAREIVQILLAAGADPSIVNKSGKRPIEYVTNDAIRSLLKDSG